MKIHKEWEMQRDPSGERGIALILVMFMVMAMSLVGASLTFVSRNETLSSMNYQTTTQTRYAAESGVAAATNYLLNTYVQPTTGGADPLAAYDMTVSPVRWNNAPVVLSSDPAVPANYPIAGTRTDFANLSAGALTVGSGTTAYTASATLLTMKVMTDALTGGQFTLQMWRITGAGAIDGAGAAAVQVSAVLETTDKPVFQYAAFATNDGCDSIRFVGGAFTDSYDSSIANDWMVPAPSGGDIGTNGNFNGGGLINGSLSTPRTGVGNCAIGGVTATSSTAHITGGLTPLSQPVTYSSPPPPNPLPPTTDSDIQKNGGCPAGVLYCTADPGAGVTIVPPTASSIVTLGNVKATGGAIMHLSAGIYVVNSITLSGGSTIVIDSGPVIFKVAGVGETVPIDLSGGGVTNTSMNPSNMQFYYGGTGTMKLTGSAALSATVVAPNAAAELNGTGDLYGAIVTATVSGGGNAAIHYDRNLLKHSLTQGNPVLHQFSWNSY
jgi:Tfp pilus assembly protein PilX